MNSTQEHHQDYEIQPFFSVWLHPKKTVQYLIDHKSWTYMNSFILLGGIASAIAGLEDTVLYPSFKTWLLLVMCIFSGPIIGAVSVFLSTVVTWLVGKIFGGKGSFEDIWKVMSISVVPSIAITPFLMIWMANSPQTYFDTDYETSTVILIIATIISILITLVVSVWSFVISVAGVSVAHRFSNWKAFFTLFIPSFLLIVGLIIFVVLILITFSII